jgi:hypothetical protein
MTSADELALRVRAEAIVAQHLRVITDWTRGNRETPVEPHLIEELGRDVVASVLDTVERSASEYPCTCDTTDDYMCMRHADSILLQAVSRWRHGDIRDRDMRDLVDEYEEINDPGPINESPTPITRREVSA